MYIELLHENRLLTGFLFLLVKIGEDSIALMVQLHEASFEFMWGFHVH